MTTQASAQDTLARAFSLDADNDQTDEDWDAKNEWWATPSEMARRILARVPDGWTFTERSRIAALVERAYADGRHDGTMAERTKAGTAGVPPTIALRPLIQHLKALVEDPLMFSTDPDGDCFFCGEPCEPVAEHDADSDCRVFQMRKAWGEVQAAAVLAAVTR